MKQAVEGDEQAEQALAQAAEGDEQLEQEVEQAAEGDEQAELEPELAAEGEDQPVDEDAGDDNTEEESEVDMIASEEDVE